MTKPETCLWQEDDDGNWNASCGEDIFCFFEGGPSDNRMRFCCYCGKRLEERWYEPEGEDA